MSTQEEREDMLHEAAHYPFIPDANIYSACSQDLVLRNMAFLKEAIEHEESHLSYMKSELEKLKSRAIAENIKTQGKFYLIKIPGKKMRNPIDIIAFNVKFPEAYMKIRDRQYVDLADKYEKERATISSSAIPLGMADKLIGSEVVTEFTGFKPQAVMVDVGIRQDYGRLK